MVYIYISPVAAALYFFPIIVKRALYRQLLILVVVELFDKTKWSRDHYNYYMTILLYEKMLLFFTFTAICIKICRLFKQIFRICFYLSLSTCSF